MYGLVLAMKLMKQHMYGLQGKHSVIPIGNQGSQTMLLPRTMVVCIIILERGGMIMALKVTTMFLKFLPPRRRHHIFIR